nr:FecR domain-containing protein [Asticcacaulis solisilvae]
MWAVKDRPLSPEDEAALGTWLAGDPRRRGALLRAQAAWSSLSRAKALGPSTAWPAVRDAVSRRKVLTSGGIAAGLMAACGAGLFVTLRGEETATRTGEIRRLPMSDGSIAAINTQSAIRVAMTEKQRHVELVKGEVWFKVAKNPERPFVVAAGDARVQAVGTAFSVRRRDNGAEVLVTEGTVKAWFNGADRPAVILKAGDRTFIGEAEAAVYHAPEVVDNALAWREGKIALAGKTLADVASDYNRYNRTQIVIRDAALGGERLFGRFSTDDPEGFSNAVAQAFDAEVTRTDTTIYIGVKKINDGSTEAETSGIGQ